MPLLYSDVRLPFGGRSHGAPATHTPVRPPWAAAPIAPHRTNHVASMGDPLLTRGGHR